MIKRLIYDVDKKQFYFLKRTMFGNLKLCKLLNDSERCKSIRFPSSDDLFIQDNTLREPCFVNSEQIFGKEPKTPEPDNSFTFKNIRR